MRILISMRLKDKAQVWFHSMPEHLEISMNKLIRRMQSIFDHRPTRIDLRRQFEKRTWRYGGTFGNYFANKIILANRVSINEEEMTNYLIDGIPDNVMRNQARI